MWPSPPSSPTMVGRAVATIVPSSPKSNMPTISAPMTSLNWRFSIGRRLTCLTEPRRGTPGSGEQLPSHLADVRARKLVDQDQLLGGAERRERLLDQRA